MDTTTAPGRMMMQMLGSFAEFERSMVRERTRAGLAAARDRGVKVGRPAKLTPHQQQEIIRTVREGSKTHLLFNFGAETASEADLQPFRISFVAIHAEFIA